MIRQLASKLFHESHVGANNSLQNTFPEKLNVLLSVLLRNEIILVEVEEFEGFCGVITLLNTNIPIHLIPLGKSHHMVPIIKTIVFNIVAEGSHKKSQGIEIVELGELRQSLRIHNEMAMLGDI